MKTIQLKQENSPKIASIPIDTQQNCNSPNPTPVEQQKEKDFESEPILLHESAHTKIYIDYKNPFATSNGRYIGNQWLNAPNAKPSKEYIGISKRQQKRLLKRLTSTNTTITGQKGIIKKIINSQTGSGKTAFILNVLIPYYKNLHGDNLLIIIALPRLTLLSQFVNEYIALHGELVQFSGDNTTDEQGIITQKQLSPNKYKPSQKQEHKAVATTYNGASKLIQIAHNDCPNAKILVIGDEIHTIADSSFMNLADLANFADSGICDFISFTATAYMIFEKLGWDVITIARPKKDRPIRSFKYVTGFEGNSKKENTPKKRMLRALAYIRKSIYDANFKNVLIYIESVNLAKVLKKVLESDLEIGKKYDIDLITGKSSKNERDNNKALNSIKNKETLPKKSILIATKTLDTGVNIKGGIGAIFYLAEISHNIVNLTTFLQFIARNREFSLQSVYLINPYNPSEDKTGYESPKSIDFDSFLAIQETICKNQKISIKQALYQIENLQDISKEQKEAYSNIPFPKSEFISNGKVNKYVIAEKTLIPQLKKVTLDTLKHYVYQFYNVHSWEQINYNELQDDAISKIEKLTKKEAKEAYENISNVVNGNKNPYVLHQIADIICNSTLNIESQIHLSSSYDTFKTDVNNKDQLIKEAYEIVYPLRNNIESLHVKLTNKLYKASHLLSIICRKDSKDFNLYSNLINTATFCLSDAELKMFIYTFSFVKYDLFRKKNSKIQGFKVGEKNIPKAIGTAKEYEKGKKFISDVKKCLRILDKTDTEQSKICFNSNDLFSIYTNLNPKQKDIKNSLEFLNKIKRFWVVENTNITHNNREQKRYNFLVQPLYKKSDALTNLQNRVLDKSGYDLALKKDTNCIRPSGVTNIKSKHSSTYAKTDTKGQQKEKGMHAKTGEKMDTKGQQSIKKLGDNIFLDFVVKNNVKFKLSSNKNLFEIDIDKNSNITIVLFNEFLDKHNISALDLQAS